ncbi:AAA family ATPase [Diaphorobacter sp. HDW4B]|uniref:AAA family ATPase n=1 Tax=Diaphorobacter sp. HDW4B TaxID=2714925 RepID=UPI00140C7023|nr:AAA family ATPase [Diaphorobacter sp. HDW4B]QIL72252.1 AAA family ATPase [Diaphorobacter sp. HDW4B]
MLASDFIIDLSVLKERIPTPDAYPFNLPFVRDLERLKIDPKVTLFVGENGSGKSTLLEAIAVAMGFNPEGGSRNFRFSTRASHSELHQCLRIAKGFKRPRDGYFLRAESFFNVASEIENLDREESFGPPVITSYGGHSLHEQSHGESFITLLEKRFGGLGLYILDEPEAALSPQRQLTALKRMHALVKQRSQFIIATHSPILMAYPGALIYQFSSEGVRQVAYRETEHFKVMREFMLDPEAAVKTLL